MLKIYKYKEGHELKEAPFFTARVAAGFPSPADDFVEKHIDLNELLVEHPAATFFVRVEGESMINAGIHDGDVLIVDRSLRPGNGNIVVAVLDGELTVKRIKKKKNRLYLAAENSEFPVFEITGEMELRVWGVVTNVIHPVR
jgi:DNA polymerase V